MNPAGRFRFACVAAAWLSVTFTALADPIVDCDRAALRDARTGEECLMRLADDDDALVRARALTQLGDPRLANGLFRQINTATPSADARYYWGALYQSIHQVRDAERLFQEALGFDPDHINARLGLAQIAVDRFEGRARELSAEILALSPSNADALLMNAYLDIEAGRTNEARELIDPITTTADPRDRARAFTLLAAIDHLNDALPSANLERAIEIAPASGAIFLDIGHFYIITRRYKEAVAMFERAVTVEPKLWRGHATLGLNLLRVDRLDDARRHLETAYEGDPYNAEVVNTLRLLDAMDGYERASDGELTVWLHADESGPLMAQALSIARAGLDTFAERYGYRTEGRVLIELHPTHEDFAVRTSGLPGIGILGAAFGNVVVMDSPRARTIEEGFDWASALWHETAHIITLGATDNRVSRWFSEGVSVFEEWRTGPAQRRSIPTPFIDAMQNDLLLGVARLDEGFIRPQYPDQIGVSYTQAGLICEFIEAEFGLVALRAILAGYREGLDNVSAFEAALDLSIDEFDTRFFAYLDERFGSIDLDRWRAASEGAFAAARDGDWEGSRVAAETAIASYPDFIENGHTFTVLADAHAQLGDLDRAQAVRAKFWRKGGRDPAPLADYLEHADPNDVETLAIARSLALVAPFDLAARIRAGELLTKHDRFIEAQDEFRAALELDPVDRAGIYLALARAEHAAGQDDGALASTLAALEIAPRFRPALELLLELNR